jgi:hypothetical protein
MPLTIDKHKIVILNALKDDEQQVLPLIDLLFLKHDDITPLKLRALYVQRDAAYILAGNLREQFNFSEKDRRVDLQDKFDNAMALYERSMEEIKAFSAAQAVGGQGAYVGGTLTTTAPVAPPAGWGVDGNSRAYSGSIYDRGRRRPS